MHLFNVKSQLPKAAGNLSFSSGLRNVEVLRKHTVVFTFLSMCQPNWLILPTCLLSPRAYAQLISRVDLVIGTYWNLLGRITGNLGYYCWTILWVKQPKPLQSATIMIQQRSTLRFSRNGSCVEEKCPWSGPLSLTC